MTAADPRSVACPYCKAAPGEHCRTMNGNLTGRYGTRVNHYRREVAARRERENVMTAARPDAQLLTIPDTAERLRCSDDHVYRLITTGKLRATDIAQPETRKSKTRIREDDLAAYINSQTRLISA